MVLCTWNLSRTCTFFFISISKLCKYIWVDYSSQLLYAVHCFHAVYTYKTIFKCRHLVISRQQLFATLDFMLCNVMLCYVMKLELAFSFFMEDTVTLCTVIFNKYGLSTFLYNHLLQTHTGYTY